MSEIAITVENLSKSYLVGHRSAQRERHSTLRDVIAREAKNFWRNAVDLIEGRQIVQGDEVEVFWALKDLDFKVKAGEVVGIIGRNGAGKSTLLKVLSQITEPTKGRVTLRGRVASLLEVGTGFHVELSGRENIFLNGAILGMSQREIRKKFDEIVAFAEIEKFLDTPVKRYSSGMYVRLAFAVAAHLEPEILIVDEVLAVGDIEFQKKCLGKLEQVSSSGRTVLFVSHDIDAVERLTSRCLLLTNGILTADGPTREVITRYLHGARAAALDFERFRLASTRNTVSLADLWTENMAGGKVSSFRQGEPFRVKAVINVADGIRCDLALVVETARQHSIFASHLTDLGQAVSAGGRHEFSVTIDAPNLRSGDYLVSFAAFSMDHKVFFDLVRYIPMFTIAGSENGAFPHDTRDGDIYIPLEWRRIGGLPCN
jgi:lipopolysaccharide transport system ATP-binding protein